VDIVVRAAGPGDAPGIRAVHLAAFPTALEAGLVERLEQDGDVVLSLVALERASPSTTAFGRGPPPRTGEELRIVGHVLISRMTAEGDGRRFRAVGLAPVAVIPERQRSGIGSRLIREALVLLEGRGEELVFLVGEPEYYRRFGFAAETAAPFASPYAGPYFMALALNDTAIPQSGRADYAPAFAGFE
jgi:putative acetyltransferase